MACYPRFTLTPSLELNTCLRPRSVARNTIRNGCTGVQDLQEQDCKLGVYNAEKGERGILSLQVYRQPAV